MLSHLSKTKTRTKYRPALNVRRLLTAREDLESHRAKAEREREFQEWCLKQSDAAKPAPPIFNRIRATYEHGKGIVSQVEESSDGIHWTPRGQPVAAKRAPFWQRLRRLVGV